MYCFMFATVDIMEFLVKDVQSQVQQQRSHTKEKPFRCDLCDKQFSVRRNLVVHKRIHKKENPYECDICRRQFACISNLVVHQRIHTDVTTAKHALVRSNKE